MKLEKKAKCLNNKSLNCIQNRYYMYTFVSAKKGLSTGSTCQLKPHQFCVNEDRKYCPVNPNLTLETAGVSA